MDAAGIDRAVLVGASLGGRVALEIALAEPDRVSALVLVGPGLPDHEWSRAVRDYGAAEDAAIERGDLDAAAERLGEIRHPALVLVGEVDQPDIHAIAARLVEHLPNSTLATIPAAAHLPSLERPEPFGRLVTEFLGVSAPA